MSTLYLVATPIGNLEDITLRALRVLKEVDLIACEDTRRTKILLDRYEVKTPVVSYHQHSRLTKVDWLIDQLKAGKDIALVSDAGTPGINDPGGQLVAAATRENSDAKSVIQIVPIPGPNAGVTLLSVSGWPADQYLFLGYLPKKKGRQTLFKKLSSASGATDTSHRHRTERNQRIADVVVLYESPHRLVKTLTDFQTILGSNSQIIIGRELTKQFEEIWRGTVAEAATFWSDKTVRGELVLAVFLGE